LQPERITEIQKALSQAGYLKRDPKGKWDDATRDAMRRFQEDHGFSATGLPEAKSLMKLGLGPHPLSEEFQANAAPRPGAADATKPAPLPSGDAAPGGQDSSTQTPPRQNE
jgi:peptidoglycan hydrolase-like protein with peptidoglycan-binding domain